MTTPEGPPLPVIRSARAALSPKHVVDWDALTAALEMACDIRACSLRDAASAMGISPSGLSRLRHDKALSGDGLAALVAWLFPGKVPNWIKPNGDAP